MGAVAPAALAFMGKEHSAGRSAALPLLVHRSTRPCRDQLLRRRRLSRGSRGDGHEVQPFLREPLLLGEECADVEGLAAAAGRSVEPAAYAFGAVDELFNVGQLALGEGLKLFVSGLAGVGGVQKHADVVECEAGALGDVDYGEPGERVLAIAALAADAC